MKNFPRQLSASPAFGREGTVAFSLVEVVVALAIFSFALVTILALLGRALTTNKESSDEINAANIASVLISTRRGSPTNAGSFFSTFALPPLNQPAKTNITVVGLDGTTSATTGTTYNLYYIAGTNATTGAHMADIYMLIWWPVGAPLPTNNASAYYELSSQVLIQ